MPTKNQPPGRADFTEAVERASGEAWIASLIPPRGLTTGEVARRYRVGEDKVRAWITSGKLGAINTSNTACARPRYVVLPEHLATFERARAVAASPKSVKRPRRRSDQIDFFPD